MKYTSDKKDCTRYFTAVRPHGNATDNNAVKK